MKHYFLSGIILAFLTGCASLPVLIPGNGYSEDQLKYYYDVDSGIAYSVGKDDNNLYINLTSDNESTIRSLFRQGLYIYLDPNGRRSKEIYFNYPLSGKMGGPGGPGMMPRGQMQKGEGQQQTKPVFSVNDLIDNADMEAIFSYRDLAEKMPVYSQRTHIAVTLTSPKEGEFIYQLRVPFNRLGKEDLSQITVGIETGMIEMPSMGGGPGGGMQGGMPGGGNMGGNPPSGGAPGGGQGGELAPRSNMKDISIWFNVEIISASDH